MKKIMYSEYEYAEMYKQLRKDANKVNPCVSSDDFNRMVFEALDGKWDLTPKNWYDMGRSVLSLMRLEVEVDV